MSAGAFTVRPLDAMSEGARRLLRLSDSYAMALYPPESNHLDSPAELRRSDAELVGAFCGDELVGCGAVKVRDDDGRYGEIKRVFVVEEHRGKGIATAIMRYLEDRLRQAGVGVVRLETGVRQPGALALYHGLGFTERGPFGDYGDDPLSIFMEKRLT